MHDPVRGLHGNPLRNRAYNLMKDKQQCQKDQRVNNRVRTPVIEQPWTRPSGNHARVIQCSSADDKCASQQEKFDEEPSV